MCPKDGSCIEGEEDDKLSNLTTALLFIESGEAGSEDFRKLEPARHSLIDAVRGFRHSRFALGRALSEYKPLFKQEKLWQRAEKEIAAALGCNPRTISRIIEESEAAAKLHPFVLKAMDQNRIDPGKKRNAPVVDELLKRPKPKSLQEANAEVQSAGAKVSPKRKGKTKPVTESIEGFTSRLVKLFEARFEDLSPEERISDLRFCLNKVLTALHTDPATLYDFRKQGRERLAEDNRNTAAA